MFSQVQLYRLIFSFLLLTGHGVDFLSSLLIFRITAAVEKVELLWQQAFAKAHLQLQVLQLGNDALQVGLPFHHCLLISEDEAMSCGNKGSQERRLADLKHMPFCNRILAGNCFLPLERKGRSQLVL